MLLRWILFILDTKIALQANQPLLTQVSDALNVRIPISNGLWFANSSLSANIPTVCGPFWEQVVHVFEVYIEQQKQRGGRLDTTENEIPTELQHPWSRVLLMISFQRRAGEFHSSDDTPWNHPRSWTEDGRFASRKSTYCVPSIDHPALVYLRLQIISVEGIHRALRTRDFNLNNGDVGYILSIFWYASVFKSLFWESTFFFVLSSLVQTFQESFCGNWDTLPS